MGIKIRKARGEEVHDCSLGLFQQSGTWLFNLVAGGSCVTLSKEVNLSEYGRCHQHSPPVLGLCPFNKQSVFDLSAPGLSLRALSGLRHNVVRITAPTRWGGRYLGCVLHCLSMPRWGGGIEPLWPEEVTCFTAHSAFSSVCPAPHPVLGITSLINPCTQSPVSSQSISSGDPKKTLEVSASICLQWGPQ